MFRELNMYLVFAYPYGYIHTRSITKNHETWKTAWGRLERKKVSSDKQIYENLVSCLLKFIDSFNHCLFLYKGP